MTVPNATVTDGEKTGPTNQRRDSSQAWKRLHESRVATVRRQCSVPKRMPQEMIDRIRTLLLSGKSQAEVKDIIQSEGTKISINTVGKIWFSLHEQGLVTSQRRARPGYAIGRPRGSTGTKWSVNREKIIALRMADPTLSPSDIAERIGITADAVRRILREFKTPTATEARKK